MIIEEIIFVVLFFQYFILGVNEASSKEYNIQENEDRLQTEQRIANEIMKTVMRLALPIINY